VRCRYTGDCVADEPALVVTSPANGSLVSAGSIYTLAWQGGLKSGNVTLLLMCSDCGAQYGAFTGYGVPNTAIVNTQSIIWTVTAGIPSSLKYTLMVVSASDVSNFDISDTFAVNGVVPGYTWVVGQFGACSKSCGGGTWTRPVTCQASSGSAANMASVLHQHTAAQETDPCLYVQ